MKNPVEINLETLTEQVNVKGMKKKELADHYGIPVTQMTKALQAAGLKIRKFHHPAFVLTSGVAEDKGTTVAPVAEAVTEEVADGGPGPDTTGGDAVGSGTISEVEVTTPTDSTSTSVEKQEAEWK